MYEIWTSDLSKQSEFDGGSGQFAENTDTIEEAIKARNEYHSQGLASWILDEQGNLVSII